VGPAAAVTDRQSAAGWVRQHLPICSAFAAELRDAFGPVKLTFASEDGHVIGKASEPAAFSVSGADLVPEKLENP